METLSVGVYPEVCYTCGTKIGEEKYLEFRRNKNISTMEHSKNIEDQELIDYISMKDSLDIMNILSICCRRMYLQHAKLPKIKKKVTLT